MKHTFKMEVVAKGSTRVFDEQLGPGVLYSQELVVHVPDDHEGDPSVRLARTIMDHEDDMLKRIIEVRTEEIPA